MSLPQFDKLFLVLVNSYVGDGDHTAVDFYETDSLNDAKFFKEVALGLTASWANPPGLGGNNFKLPGLAELYDRLNGSHPEQLKQFIDGREDCEWLLNEAAEEGVDIQIVAFRDAIQDHFSPVGEGFYDMSGYFRTVTEAKIIRLKDAEVVNE